MARLNSTAPAEAQPSPSREAMEIAARVNALPAAVQKELARAVEAQSRQESAPPIPAEALAAQVDRSAAFGATPQGEALTAADDALIEVVACIDVVIRALDAEDAGCHEVTVLRMAAARLLAAQESLEALERAATRPAEGARS